MGRERRLAGVELHKADLRVRIDGHLPVDALRQVDVVGVAQELLDSC
jgi:hypothetical protein